VRRVAAAQGLPAADHPLLREVGQGDGPPAWFENTVLDAMDKYRRGARLGGVAADER